ncbi:MAG TPA: hypothetical protein VE197_09900 [Mycobacterium sp.]|nr:hypothetical protein [Mycobacterium sp.]
MTPDPRLKKLGLALPAPKLLTTTKAAFRMCLVIMLILALLTGMGSISTAAIMWIAAPIVGVVR